MRTVGISCLFPDIQLSRGSEKCGDEGRRLGVFVFLFSGRVWFSDEKDLSPTHGMFEGREPVDKGRLEIKQSRSPGEVGRKERLLTLGLARRQQGGACVVSASLWGCGGRLRTSLPLFGREAGAAVINHRHVGRLWDSERL